MLLEILGMSLEFIFGSFIYAERLQKQSLLTRVKTVAFKCNYKNRPWRLSSAANFVNHLLRDGVNSVSLSKYLLFSNYL